MCEPKANTEVVSPEIVSTFVPPTLNSESAPRVTGRFIPTFNPVVEDVGFTLISPVNPKAFPVRLKAEILALPSIFNSFTLNAGISLLIVGIGLATTTVLELPAVVLAVAGAVKLARLISSI